jgi:hypothetical protein
VGVRVKEGMRMVVEWIPTRKNILASASRQYPSNSSLAYVLCYVCVCVCVGRGASVDPALMVVRTSINPY